MSHIYIFSPSGAVRDKAAFKRGLKHLRTMGHEVEVDADALTSYQRFAGDDATRLAAIGRAAASGADVAMVTRGGYGLTRLLPALPYAAIAKSIEAGTQFVGLSDFTALGLAVLAQTGAITWQGPALVQDFGAPEGPDDIMQACFEDLLLEQGEGAGWRLPKSEADSALEIHNAKLWGGNLAVLVSLLGTPYFPKVKGGVLFLEDVGEHPYRLERMLTQLLHAGLLSQQKAIVLGQFTSFKLVPHDKGFKLASVVQWLRSQLAVPVLTGLPFGHVATKVLLPVGAKVDLVTEGRDALLVWGHV
jgi:muramoyltetrapeptide carboxypeptidase